MFIADTAPTLKNANCAATSTPVTIGEEAAGELKERSPDKERRAGSMDRLPDELPGAERDAGGAAVADKGRGRGGRTAITVRVEMGAFPPLCYNAHEYYYVDSWIPNT